MEIYVAELSAGDLLEGFFKAKKDSCLSHQTPEAVEAHKFIAQFSWVCGGKTNRCAGKCLNQPVEIQARYYTHHGIAAGGLALF